MTPIADFGLNLNHGFITNKGVQLHYVSQGEGELMLMLHGFPEFWYSWRHQLATFSSDYRVVAPDLRGYNDSDKPSEVSAYRMAELVADVEALITGLGYDRCILVAHDWGGAIAWNYAYAHPDRVSRLIVMNLPHPACFAEGLRTPQQLLRSSYIFFFQLPWLPEMLLQANDYALIGEAFSNMLVDKSAMSETDLRRYRQAAAKPGALTAMLNYYRCLMQENLGQGGWLGWPVANSPNSNSWGTLTVPTLLIWGEEDTALGRELTEGTDRYVSNLELCYIPRCSHWVQQEQPDRVNQAMRDFLDRPSRT